MTRPTRLLRSLACAVLVGGPGASLAAEKTATPALVVTAAAVHAGDGTVHAPGALLVVDGRITAIGASVEAPEGARRRDLGGAVITPWMVDPQVLVPLSGNEPGRPDAAILRAADARDPFEPLAGELRARGIAAVGLVPVGGSGVLGRTAAVALEPADVPVLADEVALAVSLADAGRGSAARASSRQALAQALDDAQQKVRERTKWEAERAKSKREKPSARKPLPRGKPGGPAPLPLDEGPQLTPATEVLRRVVEKKLPLRVRAERASDVAFALDLAERREIALTLAGCLECATLAERLERSQAIVVLDPHGMPARRTAAGVPSHDLVPELARAGVRVAATGGGTWPRGPLFLRAAAAALAGRGLPRARAVAAITGLAAEAAGAPDAGRLAPGGKARWLEWSGDPLEPTSRLLSAIEDADDLEGDVRAPTEASAAPVPRALGGARARGFAICADRAFDGERWREHARVLVRDGLVDRIADGCDGREDVHAIVLTPGLVDGDSAFGIASQRDELPEAFSPDLRLADALAPDPSERESLRRSGVTSAELASGPFGVLGGRGAIVQPAAEDAWPTVLRSVHGATGSLTASSRPAERAPSSLPEQARALEEHVDRLGAAARPLRLRFDDAASARVVRRLGATGVGAPATEDERVSPLVLSGLGPGSAPEQWRLAVSAIDELPRATRLGSGMALAGPLAVRTIAHRLIEEGARPDAVLDAACGDGGIEPGARADLVAWDGDPTSLASRPLAAWVGGEEVFRATP